MGSSKTRFRSRTRMLIVDGGARISLDNIIGFDPNEADQGKLEIVFMISNGVNKAKTYSTKEDYDKALEQFDKYFGTIKMKPEDDD